MNDLVFEAMNALRAYLDERSADPTLTLATLHGDVVELMRAGLADEIQAVHDGLEAGAPEAEVLAAVAHLEKWAGASHPDVAFLRALAERVMEARREGNVGQPGDMMERIDHLARLTALACDRIQDLVAAGRTDDARAAVADLTQQLGANHPAVIEGSTFLALSGPDE